MGNRNAILVSYSNRAPVFVIEGFLNKSVELSLIREKIICFFERLEGIDNVAVEEFSRDFIVTTKNDTFTVTWTWVSSISL